ncbi:MULTISPECIES: hypothetical protein [Methanobacterium]|uniref:DUF3566 domain-containing protein n=1 Tax=Methanobacterium bryantii TaxID=2161 RepID=A0A2A2H1B6_METBR|nr:MULTISPECIES: hypothetical protein [Methanobacterium]OEC86285.1 hypothetical protein A9507_11235 [Methanobacterium sp. A39]PAV03179.1 hypothetical protein ASJ80_07885 [Methanobacterium bryantii]
MVDVKEIKSVELAPFTLMSSSIHAILAFIAAIITLIAFGIIAALVPQASVFGSVITSAGAALIIIYPIAAFFIYLAISFFTILLYNGLAPRLGGIKLGLEGNEVTNIPVVSFSLILAAIETIWAFIIGVFLAAAITPVFTALSSSIPVVSQAIANATNATNMTIPTGQAVAAGGVFLAIILIIGLPIMAFIFGFIGNALAAIFYNYIATKVSKIQLNFDAVTGTLKNLTSIPVVPASLAVAIVFTIFGLLRGLADLASLSANGNVAGGVGALIASIVGYFIMYFIGTALITIFYNALAPRIGAVKLELE